MGRTKGSKNKVKSNKVNPTSKKPVNEQIQEKNIQPHKITLNNPTFPTGETYEDKEWKNFKLLVERNIEARLCNIVLKLFKWNVTDELDARAIEDGYLYNGFASIFYDPEYGHLSLGAIPSYKNVYNKPTLAMAYGYNDYVKPVKIYYDRPIELPSTVGEWSNKNTPRYGVMTADNDYGHYGYPIKYIDVIKEYTKILTDLKLAMLISAQRLKDPFIIAVKNKALGKSVNKAIRGIKNNEITIMLLNEKITDNKSVKDLIEVIDLKGNPESPKKLAELWENQFDSFLSTIGINTNPSPDKTQYVNDQEIGTNNSLIDIERDVRFDNRKKLCELAKKVLDIDISVEVNVDEEKNLINKMFKEGAMENGSNNGKKDTE